MSRTNKTHLLHIRSSRVENESPKLPESDDILYGELAINYAKGYETISIKNSDNEIVPLSFRDSIKEIHVNGVEATIEDRVATVEISGSDENVGEYTSVEYPSDFSGATNVSGSQTIADAFNSVEKTISSLTQEVLDNEIVTEKSIKALANAAGTINENDEIDYNVNTSANYINVATSLADADNILDAAIKNVFDDVEELSGKTLTSITVNGVDATIANQSATVEISGSDANVGDYESVEYPQEFSGATNVSGSQTIADAFNSVETTISALTQEVIDNEIVTEKSIKALANAAGTIDENDEIGYNVNTNANYINVAESLADADNILDTTIKNVSDDVEELSGKTLTSITVNGVDATIANQNAIVSISGHNINVGNYSSVAYPQQLSGATNVSGNQTVAQAFNAVETTVSALTQEMIKNEEVVSNAITAIVDSAGLINENNEISYNVNTQANYISAATSLADADNILDSALKNLEDNAIESVYLNDVEGTKTNKNIYLSISGSNENVGNYDSVEYPSDFSSATPVSGEQTIADAFNSVEKTISALTQEVLDDEIVTEKSIKALANAAGTINENDEIDYNVNTSANYINVATSLADADNILDAAIKTIDNKINGLSGLTNLTVNGVDATITDGVANVSISGHNENVGNYTSVTYPQEFTAATPVSGTQTIAQAFNSVETTISNLAQDVIDNDKKVSTAITTMVNAAGLVINNNVVSYDANENANYISGATSLTDADSILDATIKLVDNKVIDLSGKTLTSITVNGVDATIANQSAIVSISGHNINVGNYSSVAYPQELSGAVNVSGSQTVSQALNAIETTVSALTKEVIDNEETDANAIFDLAIAIGNVVDETTGQIKYIPNIDPLINQAQSYNEVILLLTAKIHELEGRIEALENRT